MIQFKVSFFIFFLFSFLFSIKVSSPFYFFKEGAYIHFIQTPLLAESEKPSEIKKPVAEKNITPEQKIPQSTESVSPFDLLDLPQSEIEIRQDLLEQKKLDKQNAKQLEQTKKMAQLAVEELNERIKEFKNLLSALDSARASHDTDQKENLKETAKIYDNIPPDKAALILMKLEDKKLVDLVGAMKKSAAVIAAMPPDKAKHLTDLLLERKKIVTAKT